MDKQVSLVLCPAFFFSFFWVSARHHLVSSRVKLFLSLSLSLSLFRSSFLPIHFPLLIDLLDLVTNYHIYCVLINIIIYSTPAPYSFVLFLWTTEYAVTY